jgi:preprotein translocase subunit Sec61beta
MANDSKINMPGGFGGLMRYDEEYGSKFMLSPMHVIAFIVIITLLVIGFRLFWTLPAV